MTKHLALALVLACLVSSSTVSGAPRYASNLFGICALSGATSPLHTWVVMTLVPACPVLTCTHCRPAAWSNMVLCD